MSDPDVRKETTRILRNKSQAKAIEQGKLVESTNSLSAEDFFGKYEPLMSTLDDNLGLRQTRGDAVTVPSHWLEECLKLIEQTSAKDYQNSEMKWSATKKRKEMKLPDMKYIILSESKGRRVIGFISFMITYEDGYEVVYIYEIHFVPEWQGKGLGQKLINFVETIGQNVGVTKVMLTVFRANYRAIAWYTRLGYREDEFSPEPRQMRNGTITQPSYIILSKRLKD
ncbi:uncharacterized protein Z518_04671 [Rhinocladiella mackenziei CBS 650.93]|uniref:N-alpha-acetyltransferase 40 n=1 Tax=Rhinocladiella mackenziei CBS 650.93 TaxID=1442369 RepID=A0A0D2JC74_9EURO|nr:uncharacterized protein Z518_04671 [Rhinocladiella mackenziei CBS 650.93]KIX06695.1 hypothetical protein Z518_04671 [Rhinocladiella mackenziei CBS 650.93]